MFNTIDKHSFMKRILNINEFTSMLKPDKNFILHLSFMLSNCQLTNHEKLIVIMLRK